MWEKGTIFCPTNRHKWILLLVFWAISISAITVLSLYNCPFQSMPDDSLRCGLTKNEIGPVSYVYCDPQNNLRPVYSFSFNNLWLENSELGIFKTALHKRIKIEGLSLRLYNYGRRDDDTAFGTLADKHADAKALFGKILSRFINLYDDWHIDNPDLGYVSEIRINDLDYQVFYADGLCFSIQSKRMTASYRQPEILFYGHVVVKTPAGNMLEANRVKLDFQKKYFIVDGVYALNRKGTKTSGRGICLDTSLNDIDVQLSQNRTEDDEKCLAKL